MRLAYIIFLIAFFILGCDSDEPQAIPPSPDPEILVAHNKWRSRVGVADLEWSEDLAKKAMALIDNNTCLWVNNTEGLGQNTTRITTLMGDPPTPQSVADSWASGFQHYIYDLDSCTFPLLGGLEQMACDSYKQVVWANSFFLGCASVRCFPDRVGWVCLYDPPGNIPGEKPY